MTPAGPAPSPAERVLARSADWGRAPSPHNTQPWHLTATGPGELAVGWHADRVLTVGDPTRRDLILSLGAVAEAVAITAADLGLAASPRWRVVRDARRAGVIALRPTATRGPKETFTVADLHARRTARGPYDPTPIQAETIARIARAAALPDGAALTALPADVVAKALPVADRWTFDGPTTGELREWLRLRAGDRRDDGLTAEALGLRPWQAPGLRLALSPALLPVLRGSRATRLLAAAATARPLGTVVALTAPTTARDEDVAELGQALLRVWLAAGRLGLSAHPLSQLLDCPESAGVVAAAVGAGDAAVAVFRLGVPRQPPAPSRRLTDPRS